MQKRRPHICKLLGICCCCEKLNWIDRKFELKYTFWIRHLACLTTTQCGFAYKFLWLLRGSKWINTRNHMQEMRIIILNKRNYTNDKQFFFVERNEMNDLYLFSSKKNWWISFLIAHLITNHCGRFCIKMYDKRDLTSIL